MSEHPVAAWHAMIKSGDISSLDTWLNDDVVFYSPVVHTPQRGKAITKQYLAAAFFVFFNDSFSYVKEIIGERDAALEFELELDGIHINGVDLIEWNDAGEVIRFKVMLRPLKAVNLIHEKMQAMLQSMA